jgi:hypothetical protein
MSLDEEVAVALAVYRENGDASPVMLIALRDMQRPLPDDLRAALALIAEWPFQAMICGTAALLHEAGFREKIVAFGVAVDSALTSIRKSA